MPSKGSKTALKIFVTCEFCGKTKEVYSSQAKTFRFCSKLCRALPGRVPVTCKVCGKETIVNKSGVARGQHKFCSRACYITTRIGQNTHIKGRSWMLSRAKALLRDNNLCRICHKTANEVHHIVPYRDFTSRGGANELGNLISLCTSCHKVIKYKEHLFIDVFRMILKGCN